MHIRTTRDRAELSGAINTDRLIADAIRHERGSEEGQFVRGTTIITYRNIGIGVLRTSVDPRGSSEQLFR